MRKRSALLALTLLLLAAAPAPQSPVDIGSRLEPFFDEALIASLAGAGLRLHEPVPREAVLTFDKPWEGNTSTYVTVFRDGDLFRMYYRGSDYDLKTEAYSDNVTCYAESPDGVRWTKPELGLVDWRGSKANNIVWSGPGAENFAPFKDENPACPPGERYKALAGGDKGLRAFKSADGLRWSLLREEPVLTGSWFDSLNTSFWDATRGEYGDKGLTPDCHVEIARIVSQTADEVCGGRLVAILCGGSGRQVATYTIPRIIRVLAGLG